MGQVFLGIDTSCYTTSVALVDGFGNLLEDKRLLLKVGKNDRGLRQSEMVFQHVKNLPLLLEEVFVRDELMLEAIAVSCQPRPREDSYMPTFASGVSMARSIAAATGKKLFFTSHQENHMEAGLWSAKRPQTGRFVMLHISGGTTDLLVVEKEALGYKLTELGSSSDLTAGQYIDRIGVAMGLPFPAGGHLEKLAMQAAEAVVIPVAVKGLAVSYSGPLTATLKLLDKGASKSDLAAGVQFAVAKSLAKLLKNACAQTACESVMVVGGVSANMVVRDYLARELLGQGVEVVFPETAFCGDNAVGCAVMAWQNWTVNYG